jgi:hypothetical protein
MFSKSGGFKNEKNLIPGTDRKVEVVSPQIHQHPHNCIGWIIFSPSNSVPVNGSGFLIGPSLVLSVAHNFEYLSDGLPSTPNPK